MREFDLPYPPSTNNLFVNTKHGRARSSSYLAWIKESLTLLNIAHVKPLSGPYALSIYARRPDLRARDIDNLLKPVSDLLVKANIIPDDHNAVSVFAAWEGEPIRGGALRVVLVSA